MTEREKIARRILYASGFDTLAEIKANLDHPLVRSAYHEADRQVAKGNLLKALYDIERLRAALQPFADHAPAMPEAMPDEFRITFGSDTDKRQLTIGDCRRAALALDESAKEGK